MPGKRGVVEPSIFITFEGREIRTAKWCRNKHDRSLPGALRVFPASRVYRGVVKEYIEVRCIQCERQANKKSYRKRKPDTNPHWNRKLPDKDTLNRLYHWEGLSYRMIGKKYGVGQSAVYGMFKREGITGGKRKGCKKDYQCREIVGPKGKRCEGVCVRVRCSKRDKHGEKRTYWYYQRRCAEHYQLSCREKSRKYYDKKKRKGGTVWAERVREKFNKTLGTSTLIYLDDRL